MFTNVGDFRLEVAWKTPIGGGYSGVSIANGLAVTAFDTGDVTVVAAFDPTTGEEHWRSAIGRSFPGINGSYAGPISTPLIVGSAVIALDRGGDLVAFDAASGDRVWSVTLPDEFDAQEPAQGFGTSPILHHGAVIVQTGGPGAAVTAFDPTTGSQLWTVGDDSILYQTPVPVTLFGREQLVAAGFTRVMGIDPGTGELLWEYGHEGDGWAGAESLVPVPTGPDTLFLAHSDHSSTVVDLEPGPNGLVGRERWDERTIRGSYNVPVYHDGYLYGYNRRFLVCVDAATGEAMWRSRPPGDGFLIVVDGHLVLLTKDGTLHVIEATPTQYEEVASIELFDDVVWTPPSFADGQVYARSQSELARVDVLRMARLTDAGSGSTAAVADAAGGRFDRFLEDLSATRDKAAVVDRFLASIDQFPFIEDDNWVHFLYRGPAEDMAIAGDIFGARQERSMTPVEGTDLFYYSTRLDPTLRVNYNFIRDYTTVILDPRNPRSTTTAMYTADMEPNMAEQDPTPVSWVAMPRWQPPAHLTDPSSETPRGRLVSHEIDSQVVGQTFNVEVYLPAGYDNAA